MTQTWDPDDYAHRRLRMGARPRRRRRERVAPSQTGRSASPWTFPTPGAFATILSQHHLAVRDVELILRPTPLPAGMAAWLRTFGGAFLAVVPDVDREVLIAEIVDLLAPSLRNEHGGWTADYVRLRFSAVREPSRRRSALGCAPGMP